MAPTKSNPTQSGAQTRIWTQKYGTRHRLQRILEFPAGITPPKRVRIYSRCDHFVLQWWDRAEKKTLSERIEGDLVQAIFRAREIDEQLKHFRGSGLGRRSVRPRELVEQFSKHLHRRADAGEIDPRTVIRYESALQHYVRFAEQPHVSRVFSSATMVDGNFVLEFTAYLKNLQISPNGHAHTPKRRMACPQYVLDVTRALFHWASDPQGGRLMPSGFYNPFTVRRTTDKSVADLFGEPDVTLKMAGEFLESCDAWQLPLFALFIFYGLRASEPCWLFQESLEDDWLKVECDPDLGYVTKGRRGKRLPLILSITGMLENQQQQIAGGLLFYRRSVGEGAEKPPLAGASRKRLRQEYAARLDRERTLSAKVRRTIRDRILQEAGGLSYDHIEHEFGRIKAKLRWPAEATLKDFRHLFSTCMENAGMPEFYRKFLMGQSPGRAAIVGYTHLNQLRERYLESVERQLQPLVVILEQRMNQLAKPIHP